MTYKLPEPDFVRLSDLQSGLDKSWSASSMQAAYAAGLAARVPEGWKLVPIEPTRESALSEKQIVALNEWANRLTVPPEPKP